MPWTQPKIKFLINHLQKAHCSLLYSNLSTEIQDDCFAEADFDCAKYFVKLFKFWSPRRGRFLVPGTKPKNNHRIPVLKLKIFPLRPRCKEIQWMDSEYDKLDLSEKWNLIALFSKIALLEFYRRIKTRDFFLESNLLRTNSSIENLMEDIQPVVFEKTKFEFREKEYQVNFPANQLYFFAMQHRKPDKLCSNTPC